jgi:hypothetical protein
MDPSQKLVIPTGAGAPATAQRRNLLFLALETGRVERALLPAAFDFDLDLLAWAHHKNLSFRPKPEHQRRRSGGTCCFLFVEIDRVEQALLPAAFDFDLDLPAWTHHKDLSFRPEPERQRRRSGGTCCFLFVEIDRVERALLPAAFDFDLDLLAWTHTKTCHSDRSRSASDGAAEEPAFSCSSR